MLLKVCLGTIMFIEQNDGMDAHIENRDKRKRCVYTLWAQVKNFMGRIKIAE